MKKGGLCGPRLANYKLGQARERARKARQLLDDGIDPITHREDERHTFKPGLAVGGSGMPSTLHRRDRRAGFSISLARRAH